ncbi:MAG: glycerophosphoryl diester phosphodiesterase membrane domain-containing protein [Nitratireductor sp.]|nr:glycerophosphoryl diester phosphodiesterase membrane domain-containing protein [Nitratireductor sp.]
MLQELVRLRGPILLIHVVLAAASAAVIGPLASAAIRLAIEISGKPALTDMEIARFFLTPAGLGYLVFAASVLLVFASLEIAALLHLIGAGDVRNGVVFRSLTAVAARLPRLLSVAAQTVVRLLAILLPFAAVTGAIAWAYLREHDINYYLAARPPELWTAVFLAAPVLAAALFVLVRQASGWVLVLPLVMFTKTPLTSVFAESRRVSDGMRWQIGRGLILWAAFSMALASAATFAFRLLVDVLLPDLDMSIERFVVLGAVLLLLWSAMLAVTGAVSAGLLAGFLARLAVGAGIRPVLPAMESPPARPMRFWLTAAAFAAVSASLTAAGIASSSLKADRVEVIAHRGAAALRPENTLASVRKAVEDGADWVEVDVQETADGAVVVVHDSDFMKLAGNPLKVWQASEADLAAIDIGSWFGPEYSGERTPTLRAVLEEAKGRAKVLIELKYYGHDQRLAERVVELVEAAGMADSTAFMSLEPKQVARMKELRPDWRVGTLAARSIGDPARLPGDFLAISRSMAKAPTIGHVRSRGKDVYVWTVDDPVTMSRMISRGATGLITNDPALAREVIAERADMSLLERAMLEAVDLFGVDFKQRKARDDMP